MSWIVEQKMPGVVGTMECATHKEAQHEAAVIAKGHRDNGREVLGSSKDDYYIIATDNPAQVLTVEVYHKD